jgi:hypothetical protein
MKGQLRNAMVPVCALAVAAMIGCSKSNEYGTDTTQATSATPTTTDTGAMAPGAAAAPGTTTTPGLTPGDTSMRDTTMDSTKTKTKTKTSRSKTKKPY